MCLFHENHAIYSVQNQSIIINPLASPDKMRIFALFIKRISKYPSRLQTEGSVLLPLPTGIVPLMLMELLTSCEYEVLT